MSLENIASFDVGTHDVSLLPFVDDLRTGKCFIYVCRRYSDTMGGDVHFLIERNDGSVWWRSCATGRLQLKHEKEEDEEILAELSGMDESSEEFNRALIAAINKRKPSRETLRDALDRAEPAIDFTRESSKQLLEFLLGLAKSVGCDESLDVISCSAERILAFDGETVFDIKTWHKTTNLKPLFEALASEFDIKL